MDKGFYLDSQSTWYSYEGKQLWGIRFINFLQETLDTVILQGLDKLIVYTIQFRLRQFYFEYGTFMGAVKMTKEQAEKYRVKLNGMPHFREGMNTLLRNINGNFESLNPAHAANYASLIAQFPKSFARDMLDRIQYIGQL